MTAAERAREELLERLRRLREEAAGVTLPAPPPGAPAPPRPWSETDDDEDGEREESP